MFGEIVRGHRRRMGLTQDELAERTGISVRSIRDLEADRVRTPRVGTLRVLADAFRLEGSERDHLFTLSPGATMYGGQRASGQSAARFSLPPDTTAFTGRATELAAITATVTQAAQRGGVVAIHAIDGMPGIGKTTLAVHAAHQLTHQYPDGQMFVDLHAHTPGLPSTQPTDALAELLRADGVDPRQLPDNVDARTALWRDRMTGRRTLLVLDNVRSTAQVAPLLPGSDTVLVLITSRRRLGDLRHAAHLHVNVLPQADAIAMFQQLAPHAADSPDAVDAVTELVRMCEYLPLAIAILASRYAAHPTWTVTDLLMEFRDRRQRLLTVKSENATVHAAFDLSYQQLPAARQHFFHLLGLTPGVDIDSYAAAALTATTIDEAAEHLDELYNDHLLDETAPHRYRMHDLIRAYTHTQAATTESADARERAVDRLLDYYQHTAHHADSLVAVYTRPDTAGMAAPSAAPDVTGWDQALAWLRAERPNLQACLHRVTTGHQLHRVAGLTAGLATLLLTEGPWDQAIALQENAIFAATCTGDQASRAGALHASGRLRLQADHYHAAEDLLHQALAINTEVGHRRGQGANLNELGRVRLSVGDYPAADNLFQQALTIQTETGDRRGQASTLHELGVVRRLVGDYPAADNLLHQALAAYTEIGNRYGHASALHHLGVVRRLGGDYPAADNLLHQALAIQSEIGNRRIQASTLNELGVVRRLGGDYPAADNLLHQALTIHTESGNRQCEAETLIELGIVRRLVGDYPVADNLLHQALTIQSEIGDQRGHASTLLELGLVRRLVGDYPAADNLLQQAIAALRSIGVAKDEAEALNHLGTLRRITGHPHQAHTHHTEALILARRGHYRLQEAQALEGIGCAALDRSNLTTASAHLRQALELYQQLGVPEAENVAAALANLDPAINEADNQSSTRDC